MSSSTGVRPSPCGRSGSRCETTSAASSTTSPWPTSSRTGSPPASRTSGRSRTCGPTERSGASGGLELLGGGPAVARRPIAVAVEDAPAARPDVDDLALLQLELLGLRLRDLSPQAV